MTKRGAVKGRSRLDRARLFISCGHGMPEVVDDGAANQQRRMLNLGKTKFSGGGGKDLRTMTSIYPGRWQWVPRNWLQVT